MRSKIIASVDRLFEPTNMFMDKKYEGHPISSDNDPIKQNLFL